MKADIQDQSDYFENQLNYGLNPEFDPRDIVGDDYSNTQERNYGNNEVIGPDATHGTHVSGIVGALRDNDLGMNGIAQDVKIMVLRTVPDGDERDKDVANAIRYAVDNGARIVNMSFGKDFSPEKSVVDEAVQYAEKKGVLLIHAAGNDGENIDEAPNYPTRFYLNKKEASNWIEVGASSWGNDGATFVASFSNYGKRKVDIFAPGVDVYSTVPGQKYKNENGTSMAAPVVSGVAALLMSYFPELTYDKVKDIILKSARKYSQSVKKPGEDSVETSFEDLSSTGGVVNAYEAVNMALDITK
ncbi:MAG: S8 family serine peptidase [Bacteroidota bacterium]